MAVQTVEAFVLKRWPFRETSMLVSLFARTAGKIKVLVKGVRIDKRPLTAAFEPFTHVSVVYYEKVRSDIHMGTSVNILNAHGGLRTGLDRMSYASYMTELVDTLFGLHDPHDDVFDLLRTSYDLLYHQPAAVVARVFEVKLLQKVGWLPLLTECTLCGAHDVVAVSFSPRQGGIVCAQCDSGEPNTVAISAGTLRSLLFICRNQVEDAVKLRIGRSTSQELDRIGGRFLAYHLERPLRSSKFLAQIKPFLKTAAV